MAVSDKDRDILRQLAGEIAAIAALPVHQEKRDLWRRLNKLERVRPLVWINEICWPEMDVDGELELRADNDFCRGVERGMRMLLYQWKHMPGDMIVDPFFRSSLVVRDSGFGVSPNTDYVAHSAVSAQHYQPVIRTLADVEKIQTPVVTLDREATKRNHDTLAGLFGDILPIRIVGIEHRWFSPWDYLITLTGVQEGLMALAVNPEVIHAAMDRIVTGFCGVLDQWETLNALSVVNGNHRVGSGGLGITDELPQKDFDPEHVRARDQWGCATAQIFSEVSPPMHQEFSLQYERRWLDRFGLTYYGCCEPLHNKLEILKTVPNLRKISMSPWVDLEKAVEGIGDRYVFSHKPSPAVLATDDFHPARARQLLEEVLDRTRGCVVEIILKDISTVRHDPRRLWEWERIAMDAAERYA